MIWLRFLAVALVCAGIFCLAQNPIARPGPDSNYNVNVAAGGGGFTGACDQVASPTAFWSLEGCDTSKTVAANACLPADTVCADITLSAGLPVIPAGLSTCNNSTVFCTVKTLYDQSGANACAGATNCDLTEATASKRPVLVVAGAANGCTNTALPCITSIGQVRCLSSANTLTLAQPFSMVAVVVRTANFNTTQRVVTNTAVSAQLSFTTAANTIGVFAGGSATLTVADSSWHAGQGVFNGATSSMNADGGGSGSLNAGAGTYASAITLMDDTVHCGGSNLSGNMAEAGVWPVAFNAGQITNLNIDAHSVGRWNF